MPKITTPEALWLDYSNAIYRGLNISPIQYSETRQAFLAGLYAFSQVIAGLNDVPDEEQQPLIDDFMTLLVTSIETRIKETTKQTP